MLLKLRFPFSLYGIEERGRVYLERKLLRLILGIANLLGAQKKKLIIRNQTGAAIF